MDHTIPKSQSTPQTISSTYTQEIISMRYSEKHNQTTIKTTEMKNNRELDQAKYDQAYVDALRKYLQINPKKTQSLTSKL